VQAPETCDDLTLVGCNLLCSGANPGYSCIGGDLLNPSVCSLIPPPPVIPPPTPGSAPTSSSSQNLTENPQVAST